MHVVDSERAHDASRDRMGYTGRPTWTTVAIGAGLGLLAALAMTALLLAMRAVLGLPTPSELVGDRLTAFLTIQQFFGLLSQFGGYEGLNRAGGGGVVVGQL